jgi:hypothetical protein
MYELVLTLHHTPFGMCVSGPDPQRIVFLRNGETRETRCELDAEPVWSSDEVDLFVAPTVDGVELQVKVHQPKRHGVRAIVRAA